MSSDTTYAKPEDTSNTVQPRGKRDVKLETNEFLSILSGWQTVVILGHIALQVLAWTFFIEVERRGVMPAPHPLTSLANKHPRFATQIVTLVSTALAACSSFLFSFSVRKSITIRLQRPVSLTSFQCAMKISSLSLILSPRKWKWTVTSIALVLITGVQTSCWTTLLTPIQVTIGTPLSGSELDLSSPLLKQAQTTGVLDNCETSPSRLTSFVLGQTDSGYAAVEGNMSLPASFTAIGRNFETSTAGVYPMTMFDVDASSLFPGMTTIPGTLTPVGVVPDGFSQTYSMMQQGFTADVSCTFSNNTPPVQKDVMRGSGDKDEIVHVTMTSDCAGRQEPDLNTVSVYVGGESHSLLMVGCGTGENYTLAFSSSPVIAVIGKSPISCTFTPRITTVKVDYPSMNISSKAILTKTNDAGAILDVDGPAGLSALQTLYRAFYYGQGSESNRIHEQFVDLIGTNPTPETVLRSMEEYIRGVVEYSGTLLRACLSGRNGTFPDGVPANMTIRTTGMLYTQTLGWNRWSAREYWILFPGTLVALSTITIVLVAVGKHAGKTPRVPFNPSNGVHLIALSVVGDLRDRFTGTEEEDLERAESFQVVLGHIPGQGPALLCA
ncbi:hypothetical protein MVEN_00184100 [Mycena venus]|uniref:Transmembrane protein n=1 Tax=Mycena venus TaxID=2733690 RepID=A0A8H6Z0W3_9AGAR|nr:hypothetical protein MVEN_00184100 [Mycena venus]